MATRARRKGLFVLLEIPDIDQKDITSDIISIAKTKSGKEIPVHVLEISESNDMVQPLQAKTVSTEPSSHGVTRKASSALSFVKSPSWPSLKHAIQPITLINDVSIDPPLPRDTVVCQDNNDVTTTACQPTEEQDALYFSVNKSSLHNKGDEIMDINGPFCEGLSGCIDDYSDHATNQPEEGSTCMLTLNSECCYIPEKPLPIVIEDSPLVLQDDPNETITVSLSTNSTSSGNSSQYPVCCSAVATTSKTVVLVANEEPISS